MRLEEFLDCFDINCIVEITCENEPVRRCRVSAALSDDRYPAVLHLRMMSYIYQ